VAIMMEESRLVAICQKMSANSARFGIFARFASGLSTDKSVSLINLFHRVALPAWDLANTEPSPPRLARLRLPQTLEELQLALEVRTKQYLYISFSPELRRSGIPAVLGHRPADAIYSFGRFRPRAQATVQSAPTVRHGRRQAGAPAACLRSAAGCRLRISRLVAVLEPPAPFALRFGSQVHSYPF
jgi:hypothetical protein